jgi:hypothetical protein
MTRAQSKDIEKAGSLMEAALEITKELGMNALIEKITAKKDHQN